MVGVRLTNLSSGIQTLKFDILYVTLSTQLSMFECQILRVLSRVESEVTLLKLFSDVLFSPVCFTSLLFVHFDFNLPVCLLEVAPG